jgi:hypothetical protein
MAQNSHALAEVVESETTSRGASLRRAIHSSRGLICSGDDCFIHNDDIILPAPRAPALAPKVPVPAPVAPSTVCVGSAATLQAAVANGGLITLCRNSRIILSNYINLSGKTVDIRCASGPVARSCRIEGSTVVPTHLFWGSPQSAKFTGITFSGGRGGHGGALTLFDTNVILENCGFERNEGDVCCCS